MSRRPLTLLAVAGVCAAASSAANAQCSSTTGPDVFVGALVGVVRAPTTGVESNIVAFSFGTTSCNRGTQPVVWLSGTNEHPVIGQNMYRIKDGRFEQLGQSFLKHGFTALGGSVCCTCTLGAGSTQLNVNCSDPYTASRNATQSNIGPKYAVNANTGFFPYPFTSANTFHNYSAPPAASGNIGRRLQVNINDIDPALNAGAVYYGEAQYVTADDAKAGRSLLGINGTTNGLNNASSQLLTVSGASPNTTVALSGSTIREKPAIQAWAEANPSVVLKFMDYNETNYALTTDDAAINPANLTNRTARFIVAANVTARGGGVNRYSYSVMNLNSHRSGYSFSVPLPCGASPSNVYFRDVAYHSGEPFDNTDWTTTVANGAITWKSVKTYGEDQYSNALRWGTVYTFSFDMAAPIASGNVDLALFRPKLNAAEADSLSASGVPVPGAICRADFDGNGTVEPADIASFINRWLSSLSGGTLDGDFDCSGAVDPADIATYVNTWLGALSGSCP